MKKFLALLHARNREFFRDRTALAWAFVFPVLVIIGSAVAFSKSDMTVFHIGIHGDKEQLAQLPWLRQPFIELVRFAQLQRGQERVQHHQLDLLISSEGQRYWYNPQSGRSLAALALLQSQLAAQFAQQPLSGRAVRYVDWVMPGVLAMNIMYSALFGVGYVIVRYRQNGVLKRLQATPVTALQFVAAQLISRLWIVLAVNILIFVGCFWLLHLLMLGSYALLLLVALLGALSMIALGLLIASRTANEELAGGLLNALSWPMLFLSEVWFSLDNSPPWLQRAAEWMPLIHFVKAARAVMIEGAGFAEISGHLLWLLLVTIGLTAAAAVLFRWQSER